MFVCPVKRIPPFYCIKQNRREPREVLFRWKSFFGNTDVYDFKKPFVPQ